MSLSEAPAPYGTARSGKRHEPHELPALNPAKTIVEAPIAGNGAICNSGAHCPWITKNGSASAARALETGAGEVPVAQLDARARLLIVRVQTTAALKKGEPTVADVGGA